MSTITPPVESATWKKYAPAIFSALIAIGVGSEGLKAVGLNLTSGLQFAALVASTILVFIVPLTSSKWQGALKTGLEVVSVAATVAIPFIVDGKIDKSQWVLVGVAVLKALATEFGVQIRTDVVDGGTVDLSSPSVASITSVPSVSVVPDSSTSTDSDAAPVVPFDSIITPPTSAPTVDDTADAPEATDPEAPVMPDAPVDAPPAPVDAPADVPAAPAPEGAPVAPEQPAAPVTPTLPPEVVAAAQTISQFASQL